MSKPDSGQVVIHTPLSHPTTPTQHHTAVDLASSSETVRRISFRKHFPSWLNYLIVAILGPLILGAPAFIIALTHDSEEFWPHRLTDRFDPILGELFRWSALTAITFGAFYMVIVAVHLVPLLSNVKGLMGRHAEDDKKEWHSERNAEAYKRLIFIKNYIAFPVAALVFWVMVGILMGSIAEKSKLIGSSRIGEFYLTRFALALVVLAVLMLVEKIVLQRIAINYHYEYYADRIMENRFMLAALRRLRRKHPPRHTSSSGMITPIIDLGKEEAADIALSIFNGLRGEARDYLVPRDFETVLNREDALRFFESLDEDGNGDLTLKEIIQGVQNVYHERDLLVTAMAGNDDLISRVDVLGLALVGAITIAICLPIFNVGIATSVFALASFIMTARVFFSDSIVAIFGSLIFIFVSHPFDVGDTVSIDGAKYRVKDIGWWVSTFYGEGSRLVYLANRTLENASIGNMRRSGPQSEDIKVAVHLHTSRDQIRQLEERLNEFLIQHPRDFIDTTKIIVAGLINEQSMQLTMAIKHKSNFQKSSLKNTRHFMIMECLKRAMKELGIKLAEED